MARSSHEDDIAKRKYGEPLKFDPDFNGPLKRRSCTDILCLALFIVFIIVWIIIAVYAYISGNPTKLVVAVDSNGKKCGLDSEVVDKPYLFFFDLTKCATPAVLLNGCSTPQVCVHECPVNTWFSIQYREGQKPFNYRDVQSNLICTSDDIKKSVTDLNTLKARVSNGQCADWYTSSHSIYGRCIPLKGSPKDPAVYFYAIREVLVQISISLRDWLNDNYGNGDKYEKFGVHLVQDINTTWPFIVGAIVISVVICLIVIILLRWIAGFVIWLTLLLIIVLLAVGAYFSYRRYEYISNYGPIETSNRMLQGKWDELVNRKELWMFLTILASVVGIILLLIIIFLRKRICIAITLIEEGSKAVGSVISTLLFPIFPWVFQCLVLLWAISIGIFLSSMGNPIFKVHDINGSNCVCTNQYQNLKNGDTCDSNLFEQFCHSGLLPCTTAGCRFYGREVTSLTVILQLINAFGAFWGVWFVSGLSDMVLAATFATWYWTFHKRNLPFFTLTEAFLRTITYHLGTIAFGSLIIAICSFIRALIEYTERKIKKYENTCVKVIFCCCRCFFWCLERFLRFISKNAYIMCAIHGKNFCLSANDAFSLLMRNVIRVVVVDKVTDFLFFIAKIVVTAIVVAGSYFFFIRNESLHINYIWLPLVIIAAGTYIVTCIFFGVYSMAVDTLFLCFLEDCERNDGTPNKPYFMSKNLMKVLGKHNKKIR